MTSKQKTSLIFALFPLLIAVLIMAPRLASPQFGVMDDSLIYVEVQKLLQGDLSMRYDLHAGRFRPLYWLYYVLIYLLAGPNPFWFFFGHLVILLVLLVEIHFLMKAMGALDWQILLTSLVFVFSIPIIENFYTLSKGDPLSLVFLLAAVLCFEKLKRAERASHKWTYGILAFISGLFAIWAKETAYIMAPISACWATVVLLQRKKFSLQEKNSYLYFFFSMAAAMAAFFFIRSLFGSPPVTEGSFTTRYDFALGSLLERIPRWITLYASYYHYLVPTAILVLIVIFTHKALDAKQKLPFFTWGIWLLAWMGALLPWEFARAYYLLSFSLGAAILIGWFALPIVDTLKQPPKTPHWIITALAATSLLMFLASLTHYRTHAKAQLIFDRMNHQMLEITTQVTPYDGMVFISLEERKEYVEGIEYFLVDFYGLSKIDYTHIDVGTLERLHLYHGGIVNMPFVKNMPLLLVRAGVDNKFTMLWNEIVLRNQGNQLILVDQVRDDFRIVNLNLPVVLCPLVGPRGFCEHPDPFLDTRLFSYGWDIYRIK